MTAQSLEQLPLLSDAAHMATEGAHHTSVKGRLLQRWIEHHSTNRLKGMILVACSAFTFSLMSTLIKYASYSLPSMETVFWRSFVAWLFNLIAVRATGVSLAVDNKFRYALATRCFVGFIAMSLYFYAMANMVLADASVLIFTSPVVTFFLGALVLGEKIDSISLASALISFVGVVFVVRPTLIFGASTSTTGPEASPFVIACALLGAFGQAIVYVSVRSLKGLNFLVVIHYFLLTVSVLSAFSLVVVEGEFVIKMTTGVWFAVLGTGWLGFLGQLCLTRGFQLENAGAASVMRYLDVVFVFIWDSTLLHERVSAWSLLGAVIICGCAIIIAVRKMQGHH